MRSEDSADVEDVCNDPLVQTACLMGSDKCPAACQEKEDSKTDDEEVLVKSGDLRITATAATEKKAILNGATSDLDTITLKASESITLDSVTLERFGYSSAADVDAIRLEDSYGNKIAEEKELSASKDTVVLKIKKDYRELEATDSIVVVVRTSLYDSICTAEDHYCSDNAGSTIGFKVIAAESSAKNLEISDYNPYTYELVNYNGSNISLSVKGNDKTYNYSDGESYEVSRLKVQAGSAAVSVKGFTLTNEAANKFTTDETACGTIRGYACNITNGKAEYTRTDFAVFDLDEFIDKVNVFADGKKVEGLTYNVTRDNELVVSFDDVEIAINKHVTFTTEITLKDFDEYGKYVKLVVKGSSDVNAVEKKTGARVTVTVPAAGYYKEYQFNGSKIKLVNDKLSTTIDAAQGSEDVIIAQGSISVSETVKIPELVVTASWNDTNITNVIESMSLEIAGEEYEAKKSGNDFTFKNIEIEKAGKLILKADVRDNDSIGAAAPKVTFKVGSISSLNKSIFGSSTYVDSKKDVILTDVAGSINISDLKVQPSKGSLRNNLSKSVQYLTNGTVKNTVFEGTYTAKKNDIHLTDFFVYSDEDYSSAGSNATKMLADDVIAFYLKIDGEDVATIEIEGTDNTAVSDPNTYNWDSHDFSDSISDILVEAGKSVKVEVIAEISADDEENRNSKYNFNIRLAGEDNNGIEAGSSNEELVEINIVSKGSAVVSDTAYVNNAVLRRAATINLARFVITPSNNVEGLTLDDFEFTVTPANTPVRVYVDDTEIELVNGKWDAESVDLTKEGVEVRIDGKLTSDAANGEYTLAFSKINGKLNTTTYKKLVVNALVSVESLDRASGNDETKYVLNIDTFNSETVSNVKFYENEDSTTPIASIEGNVADGATMTAANDDKLIYIRKIQYTSSNPTDGNNGVVTITRTAYPDSFKLKDGSFLRVLSNK